MGFAPFCQNHRATRSLAHALPKPPPLEFTSWREQSELCAWRNLSGQYNIGLCSDHLIPRSAPLEPAFSVHIMRMVCIHMGLTQIMPKGEQSSIPYKPNFRTPALVSAGVEFIDITFRRQFLSLLSGQLVLCHVPCRVLRRSIRLAKPHLRSSGRRPCALQPSPLSYFAWRRQFWPMVRVATARLEASGH